MYNRCFAKMGSKSDDIILVIPVGNVTNSTELSYEFDIRDHVKPGPKGIIIILWGEEKKISREVYVDLEKLGL